MQPHPAFACDSEAATGNEPARRATVARMDLPVHDAILWKACCIANDRLGAQRIGDPRHYFPILSRGSWINDMNQVTAFTMRGTAGNEGAVSFTADDGVRAVLAAFWKEELGHTLRRLHAFDRDVHDKAKVLVTSMQEDVNDFGAYQPFDHADVIRQAPEVEYKDLGKPGVAQTLRETRGFLATHFREATTNDPSRNGRLRPAGVNALGRALHSVADVFAHSNYVELVLWQLALDGKLEDGLIGYFNREGKVHPFEEDNGHTVYTPLPRKDAPIPKQSPDGLLCPGLFYRSSPEATPLASCVFDTNDTVYSLLLLYATHLEKVRPPGISEQEIDLVFSVMDLAGTPMPLKILRDAALMGNEVVGKLRAVGRAARRWLADAVVSLAEQVATDPSSKALLKTAHTVIAEYHGAEAAEWARAGKLRYAAYALKEDLARVLTKRTEEGKSWLPHHTHLAKDRSSNRPDDRVRFQLASMLATELSARLLVWHFSAAIEDDLYGDFVRQRVFVHPVEALASGAIDGAEIAALAKKVFSGDWQFAAYPANVLFKKAP
jgi:hypothetical protein